MATGLGPAPAVCQGGAIDRKQQRTATIISDSRGVGLQEVISKFAKKIKYKVLAWKGRGMTEATKQSLKHLLWSKPDIIVIMAGICDMTVLDRNTRQVSLNFESEEEAVDMMIGRIDAIKHFLSINLLEKRYKLMFCQTVGMDMSAYNRTQPPHPQQELLDSTILSINIEFAKWNKENDAPTPWLASDIHHNRKRGQKITRYERLAEDGLHLTESLREKWAENIAKAVNKLLE